MLYFLVGNILIEHKVNVKLPASLRTIFAFSYPPLEIQTFVVIKAAHGVSRISRWHFQLLPHYAHESALNIVLSGKFGTMGIDYAVTDSDIVKAKALLVELHLADKIDQPFNLMSKGERQNVLIARALLASPAILVLDEPCIGLDVLAREHLLNKVRDLPENTGGTIIYVSSDDNSPNDLK